ncbi:MAG: hypothetical protein IJ515_01585 [Clostridia bacterium]|nr:hypothetical protein [Clostridia bacterium]
MIYKAVPGPKVIRIENDDLSMATNTFADLINANATDGWVFHSLETINTTETTKTGCIFNRQLQTTEHNIYMLIFCKEQ